jgi:hypothetical protein
MFFFGRVKSDGNRLKSTSVDLNRFKSGRIGTGLILLAGDFYNPFLDGGVLGGGGFVPGGHVERERFRRGDLIIRGILVDW